MGTTDRDTNDAEDLPAGCFSVWLAGMQSALRGERASDVPCAGCTACCASSQFVHIARDETETLARVPPELLFPAPGMPAGHAVLGYDEHGRCPMLTDTGCSIYEHRPRTCRTYDCRIFPAAGLAPEHGDALLARRACRWRFEHATERDRRQHEAVRAAARSLGNDASSAANRTAVAVRAIEVHQGFLAGP